MNEIINIRDLKTLEDLKKTAKFIDDDIKKRYFLELGKIFIKINSDKNNNFKNTKKELEKFINKSLCKIKFYIETEKEECREEAIFLYKFFLFWDEEDEYFKENGLLKILENYIGENGIKIMNQELELEAMINELKDSFFERR